MRKMLCATLLAALAVGLVAAATAATAKTVTVSITKRAYVPKSVTVNVGDSVKWTNSDTKNHRVSCSKCPFTSPVLKPGDTFTHVFKSAGKFQIRDPLSSHLKGTVTVNASNSVSLAADPKVVKFLQSTKLSGTVGNGKSGQNVEVLGRECGQSVFTRITAVKTGSGGAYSLKQTPRMNTVYQARWNTSTSTSVPVRVRPRIKLAKLGSHKYLVRVKAAQSFVGKRIVFQKQTASGGWTKVKRVKLHKLTIVGTTDISSSTFKSRIKHGKHVRALLKSRVAAPCYLGNHSSTITS